MKIFISHSSADKKIYVTPLVDQLRKYLGANTVIYDQYSFEAGEKNIAEIIRQMNMTDLCVILISKNAMKSKFVQLEMVLMEYRNRIKSIDSILPLIICENISYRDKDIPEWLKEYNLKVVLNINKAAAIIRAKTIEISTTRFGVTYATDLFCGRNDLIEKFERRNSDMDKLPINTLICTGVHGMGRRSVAWQCLKKSVGYTDGYRFQIFSLSRYESIEDFIFKMHALGFSNNIDVSKISTASMKEKINMCIVMSKILNQLNEIVLIEDDQCIINDAGEIKDWFKDIIKNSCIQKKVIFVIVTTKREFYKMENEVESIFYLHVPELAVYERNLLLNKLLEKSNIFCPREALKNVSTHLTGLPRQIYYAVNIIQTNGYDYLKRNYKLLDKFNDDEVLIMLDKYISNKKAMHILSLLAKYGVISVAIFIEVLEATDGYIDTYLELCRNSYFEFEGTSKEYIRLNDVIKQHVKRINYPLLAKHAQVIKDKFDDMLRDDDGYDDNDMLLMISEQLKCGKSIDNKYQIPSVYLKVIYEAYHNMQYDDVVKLSETILERSENYDPAIIIEFKRIICRALAKQKDGKCIDVSRDLSREDRLFIRGFYYRQKGDNRRALESINELLSIKRDFSQAKREKVILLSRLQQYEEAYALAKENYLRQPLNPYHIQAYFECIIFNDAYNDNKDLIEELLDKLKIMKSSKAQSMYARCNALYYTYILDDEKGAIRTLDESIAEYRSDRKYIYLMKFEVGFHFYNKVLMLQMINKMEEENVHKNSIVICQSKLYALDNLKKAEKYFIENIKYFTEESRENFLHTLSKIYNLKKSRV